MATAREKRAAQAKATLNAYRRLFSTDDGQIVLKDMMKSCFFISPTLSSSSELTHYNEGMRSVVIRILQTSKMEESAIIKLSEELTRDNSGMYID